MLDVGAVSLELVTLQALINPHQRCGYSDLPFARIYLFLYCRVQKWVGGGGQPGDVLVNGLKTHLKKTFFILLRKPRAQDLARSPGPGPGPAKKDEKS